MSHLGRRVPPDWKHVEKYPLSASTAPSAPSPVVIGVNWYSAFDHPQKDSQGNYWIGRDGYLGTVRGGHCVVLEPRTSRDVNSWWDFYNQGDEGACVGFGCSRAMSLLNRKRYFARWLWDQAKATDEYDDTKPGDDNGTSVRAALAILKDRGHVRWRSEFSSMNGPGGDAYPRSQLSPVPAEGIAAYRWATSTQDALDVLGRSQDYVVVLNSWGKAGYPHRVRMPASVLDRLRNEDGELGVIVDR